MRTHCGAILIKYDWGVGALTGCCRARAVGTWQGCACGDCGEAVPEEYGTLGHEAVLRAVTDAGCSDPEHCADVMLALLS